MESVELIASGYEWYCPHCAGSDESVLEQGERGFNTTIEIPREGVVTCKDCGGSFTVLEAEHAYA